MTERQAVRAPARKKAAPPARPKETTTTPKPTEDRRQSVVDAAQALDAAVAASSNPADWFAALAALRQAVAQLEGWTAQESLPHA